MWRTDQRKTTYTNQSTVQRRDTSCTGASMAVRTMIMRTRAALGREALATLAAVEVSLERELDWREEGLIIYLHDGHVVCTSQMDVVQLGDEDRGHGDKHGGAVHVDGGSDGHHKLPNALVNPGSVEALESDRQSCGAVMRG